MPEPQKLTQRKKYALLSPKELERIAAQLDVGIPPPPRTGWRRAFFEAVLESGDWRVLVIRLALVLITLALFIAQAAHWL